MRLTKESLRSIINEEIGNLAEKRSIQRTGRKSYATGFGVKKTERAKMMCADMVAALFDQLIEDIDARANAGVIAEELMSGIGAQVSEELLIAVLRDPSAFESAVHKVWHERYTSEVQSLRDLTGDVIEILERKLKL